MAPQEMNIEIEAYRTDFSSNQWDLPPWGHPLAQGVFPLFITSNDHLFPIGTAFAIGRNPHFVVSAAHNIREAVKREERLCRLIGERHLQGSIELKHVGISVLHQGLTAEGAMTLATWPLETIEGAPPMDVVIGFPQFQQLLPTLSFPISFDLPPIGEKVWSIGYTDFRYPADGIPLVEAREGRFDWRRDYSHRLVVVEGTIERIFTQRFAEGFVEGACFTFDANIGHAQSGGMVLTPKDCLVRGVNSAGAELFYERPASIASLLYPLLFVQLRFGVQMGPVRINASYPLADLVARRIVATDGSEERVVITTDEATKSIVVNSLSPTEMAGFVHDDFASFQKGLKATTESRPGYRLRRVDLPKASPSPNKKASD